jgi:hypothetical protein
MFHIIFEDNTNFIGGINLKKGWKDIPNKKIKSINYFFNDKVYTLKNCEQYNHIIQKGISLQNNFNSVMKVVIMGKRGNLVKRVIFNYLSMEVNTDEVLFGQEWKNKPHPGWIS